MLVVVYNSVGSKCLAFLNGILFLLIHHGCAARHVESQFHDRYQTLAPRPLQFSWIAFLYGHIHTTCKAVGFISACKLETSVMQLKCCIWKPKSSFHSCPVSFFQSISFNFATTQFLCSHFVTTNTHLF